MSFELQFVQTSAAGGVADLLLIDIHTPLSAGGSPNVKAETPDLAAGNRLAGPYKRRRSASFALEWKFCLSKEEV
jgi:hypothetical protein